MRAIYCSTYGLRYFLQGIGSTAKAVRIPIIYLRYNCIVCCIGLIITTSKLEDINPKTPNLRFQLCISYKTKYSVVNSALRTTGEGLSRYGDDLLLDLWSALFFIWYRLYCCAILSPLNREAINIFRKKYSIFWFNVCNYKILLYLCTVKIRQGYLVDSSKGQDTCLSRMTQGFESPIHYSKQTTSVVCFFLFYVGFDCIQSRRCIA